MKNKSDFVRAVVDKQNAERTLAAVAGNGRTCDSFIDFGKFEAFAYGFFDSLTTSGSAEV